MAQSIPRPSILDDFEYLGAFGGERRWRSDGGKRLYTWDSLHGEVEVSNAMSSGGAFMDLCLDGKAALNDIDDFIDRWHESPGGIELHDYLGMTQEEYSLWLRMPDALPCIIKARRDATPLADVVVSECHALRRTPQPNDKSKIARLQKWLRAKGELT